MTPPIIGTNAFHPDWPECRLTKNMTRGSLFAVNLNFLFHLISIEKDEVVRTEAVKMATFTLEMMSQGGIHDHISKGFARYSTDTVTLRR